MPCRRRSAPAAPHLRGGGGDPHLRSGYALTAGPGEVDVARPGAAGRGGATGRRRRAGAGCRPLWARPGLRRGRAAGRVQLCRLFDAERAHLNELTLVAIESQVAASTWVSARREPAGEPGGARCREHRCASACGSRSSSPCTVADGRPRPCAPTQKSVITWPTSSASTLARRCGNSRPASWPRTRRCPASPAPARSVACRRQLATKTWLVPAPLLETKLFVPRSRRGLVPRPRLSERLDRGTTSKLTLVSAPAGFGKTTLLTEWLAAGPGTPGDQRRAAALARPGRQRSRSLLDLCDRRAADGSPRGRRERAGPAAGVQTTPDRNGAYRAAQRPGRRRGRYRAGARRLPRHRRAPMCHGRDGVPARPSASVACTWIAQHTGRSFRGAASLGSGGEHAASWPRSARPSCGLRPTRPRRTSTRSSGSSWTPATSRALEARTEGWIAALQLAALSLQGRDDAAGFIAGFAGDDRYVVDYLVEEVVQRQPDARTDLPAPDVDPGSAERLPLRRGDPGERRQGRARAAGPLEPLRRAARRQPPVVPLPPPVRRRPTHPSGRGGAA